MTELLNNTVTIHTTVSANSSFTLGGVADRVRRPTLWQIHLGFIGGF